MTEYGLVPIIFVLYYISFMNKKPFACTIDAPCKINLHLAIGKKRPDGFHELESLFVPLDFHDTLRFECGGENGVCSLDMNWEALSDVIQTVTPLEIPVEKNQVFRAVSLFRERTDYKSGLLVRLDKRVPLGAGLGGGSSDAASCLLALNALAGDALPMDALREMAAVLGSDVPFFLNRGTDGVCPSAAYVSGRGERVKPVKTPEGLWVLLVKPGFSSDTAGAFRLLDEVRLRDKFPGDKFRLSPGKISLLAWKNQPADAIIKALEKEPEIWPFYNDFLPVFLEPLNFATEDTDKSTVQYQTILTNLKGAGASFAGLSGLGSCCFGVFKVRETAEKAEKKLRIPGNFVKLTFFLAHKTVPVLEY
jgi:4-diphosphocytidyl-2-C-methyl-D-erythritol kinase